MQEQSGPNQVCRTCGSEGAQIVPTQTASDTDHAVQYKEVVTSAGSLLSAAVLASWLAVFGTDTKLTTSGLALVCAHMCMQTSSSTRFVFNTTLRSPDERMKYPRYNEGTALAASAIYTPTTPLDEMPQAPHYASILVALGSDGSSPLPQQSTPLQNTGLPIRLFVLLFSMNSSLFTSIQRSVLSHEPQAQVS
jgi:hypothetical protein